MDYLINAVGPTGWQVDRSANPALCNHGTISSILLSFICKKKGNSCASSPTYAARQRGENQETTLKSLVCSLGQSQASSHSSSVTIQQSTRSESDVKKVFYVVCVRSM